MPSAQLRAARAIKMPRWTDVPVVGNPVDLGTATTGITFGDSGTTAVAVALAGTTAIQTGDAGTARVAVALVGSSAITFGDAGTLGTYGPYESVVRAESCLTNLWKCGETSGTSIADSIGSATGTLDGTATLNAAKVVTTESIGSIDLDGSSGYVATTATPFTGTATFEIWLCRDNWTNQQALFGAAGGGTYLIADDVSNDVIWYPDTGNAAETWTGALTGTGVNVHVMLVHADGAGDTSTAELFVNGVSKGQHTNVATYASGASSAVFCFGDANDSFAYLPWNGKVGWVACYNCDKGSRALAHYQAGTTAPIALAGSTGITFGDSGAVAVSVALTGSAAITFGDSGAAAVAKALAGSTQATFGAAATGKVAVALGGTTQVTFGDFGQLAGVQQMAGTTGITFGDSGALGLAAALAGSTQLVFTAAAALTTTVAPTPGHGTATGELTLVDTGSATATAAVRGRADTQLTVSRAATAVLEVGDATVTMTLVNAGTGSEEIE